MSDTPDGKTPGTVPSKRGIMSVMSTVLHPDNLDPLDFCNWYENTHIQEVQATEGINRTQRYESLSFTNKHRKQDSSGTAPENQNCKYDFITIYHMGNLAFRETDAFKDLVGQSKPDDETQLLEKIFKNAGFCTRFCEDLGVDEIVSSDTPPPKFLITIGVPSSQSTASVLSQLSELADNAKMRAYKVHEASTLSEFKRAYHDEPAEMLLLGFDSQPRVDELVKASQDHEGLELGFWALKRDYAGTEWTPAPWKPK